VEGPGELADLRDLPQRGDPAGLRGVGKGLVRQDGEVDLSGQPGDLVHHSPEHHEAQAGDDDGHEGCELRLGLRDEVGDGQEGDEQHEGQHGDEDEDDGGRFAQAHGFGHETSESHGWLELL
jgi:hypothetical protein